MNRYADIIHLPHHVSPTRPRMSIADRAAQFSPFAALTGHDDAIREAARITAERPILDESAKWHISDILNEAVQQPHIRLAITYFVPDSRKPGGSLIETTGSIKKISPTERLITLSCGTRIPIDDIVELHFLT